ncbi:SH3 domain-containing protein [Salipiger abyssi]|uniref:SH3 domain-containing protein n=1 Tax=Salipiger abyssi TaxID=1250539 RepID=A0A1P8UV71_9RHOB|nr:SH3 domain-containing protein [Salipiger abyssi]APZ53280.1 SH3 domain-containing protein [Salipiger abyssi]
MTRFILLTFGFLGWAWYEMSGGAAYQAGTSANAEAVAEAVQVPEVARAETGAADLTSVLQARAVPAEIPTPKLDVTLAAAAAETPAKIAPAPAPAVTVAAVDVRSDAAPAAPELQILPDLREVTGNRVNMRNGPGTGYSVVSQLRRGETVEVISDPGQGWVRLKVVETERVGWMSDDFLRIVLN